jgi:hypothetical protein
MLIIGHTLVKLLTKVSSGSIFSYLHSINGYAFQDPYIINRQNGAMTMVMVAI